jgi:hypothetical protein
MLKRLPSAEKFVEFVVRSDPDPNYSIALPLANGSILFVDAHRPNLVIAAKLFEPE